MNLFKSNRSCLYLFSDVIVSYVFNVSPAGPHLRGTLPCRATFQPGCQRRGGRGERTNGLRLQAGLCRGGAAGRTTSPRKSATDSLLKAAECAFLPLFLLLLLCFLLERTETDRPRQPGGPLPRWDGPCRAAVGAHRHSEKITAHTQPQDRLHGGNAHWPQRIPVFCCYCCYNLSFITVNLASVDFVELLYESSIAVKVVLLYWISSRRWCGQPRAHSCITSVMIPSTTALPPVSCYLIKLLY